MADRGRAARPDQRGPGGSARERLLRVAYELFCRHGVQAIGVDRIVAEAGVAKMTLYKHFRSKEELIVAALDLREDLWTYGWLEREIEGRADSPTERLLAIFELFDEWFRREDYEGCLFNNCLLEIHDPASLIRVAAIQKRANIRSFVQRLAEEGHAKSPQTLARDLQLLMTGAIVAADEGDVEAAQRARRMAVLVIESQGLDPW
jgi:AcrR family transcriptional regulator